MPVFPYLPPFPCSVLESLPPALPCLTPRYCEISNDKHIRMHARFGKNINTRCHSHSLLPPLLLSPPQTVSYLVPCAVNSMGFAPARLPARRLKKKKKRRASSVQFLHFSLVSRAKHNTRGRRVAWLSDTITHFEITDIYIHIKLLGGVFLSFLWPPVSRRHARSIPVTLRGENSPMPLVISSNRCTAWGTAPHA